MHDAGTATRHYQAFWQRRCRAAAAEAVLKPQGGNCAVLPLFFRLFILPYQPPLRKGAVKIPVISACIALWSAAGLILRCSTPIFVAKPGK
ncbi:MAG: hypothetical protein ACLUGI_10045 [Subdoligranulum sp.]